MPLACTRPLLARSLYVAVNNGKRVAGCAPEAVAALPLAPAAFALPVYQSFPCAAPTWRQWLHVIPAFTSLWRTDWTIVVYEVAIAAPIAVALCFPR